MFGAPLSLIPIVGVFAPPVLWMLIGWLVKRSQTRLLGLLLAVHVATVVLVLALGTPYESAEDQWKYFERTVQIQGAWLWSGIAFYIVGLVLTLLMLLRGRVAPRFETTDAGASIDSSGCWRSVDG
jgi:hypothetical protein